MHTMIDMLFVLLLSLETLIRDALFQRNKLILKWGKLYFSNSQTLFSIDSNSFF